MSLISYAGKPAQPRKNLALVAIPQQTADIAPETRSALSDALKRSYGRVTPNVVAAAVADHFGWTVERLTRANRPRPISDARALGYAICREQLGSTWRSISEAFGLRDHSTPFDGAQMHRNRCKTDAKLRADEAAILKMLGLESK